MIFKDQSSFTSGILQPPGDGTLQVHVTGPGPVAIQFQGEDGVFRSFPESTIAGPAAKLLTVPPVAFKVAITGGPTTVEVFL